MKEQDEQSMRMYLSAVSCEDSVEKFAEQILRNYDFEQRKDLGASLIEQAYSVLIRNFHKYEDYC